MNTVFNGSSNDTVIMKDVLVQPVLQRVTKKRRSAEERAREACHEAMLGYKRSIEVEREKFELVKKNQDLENENTQLDQALLIQQNIILRLQEKVQVHNKLKNAAKVYIDAFLNTRRLCGKCHEQYDPMVRPPKILACNHVFCKNCIPQCINIAEYVNSQHMIIICPEDKQKTAFPTGDIDELTFNVLF